MNVYPTPTGYRADLDNEERSAIIWAVEVARALLLRDPSIYLLVTEESVSPALLDDLADSVFLAGCKRPVAVA